MTGATPEKSRAGRSVWAVAGLILALALPSFQVVEKFLGVAGLVGYLGFVVIAVWVGGRHLLPELQSRVSERQALVLAVATFAAIVALFAVLYPLANSGQLGAGSDSDDALDLATSELLHGRYPYHQKTYLGNPISQMPGSLILASPFVLLGAGALQNPAWLVALFVVVRRQLRDGRLALLLTWTLLALSPTVLHHVVVGLDYTANSIFVLLFLWLVVSAAGREDWSDWKKLAAGIPLGVGLASRGNFVLLLPLLYSALAQQVGWKRGLAMVAVPCATAALVTAPFYLLDPAGYSPLHTAGKLAQFDSVLPNAGLLIMLASGLLSLALAHPRWNQGVAALFRNCALVQAVPILWAVPLASVRRGVLDLEFASFGDFYLFFGVVAYWLYAFGRGGFAVPGAPVISPPDGAASSTR